MKMVVSPPMSCKGHALLHKIGENKLLSNWCPIMLLDITYKIFAKALQLHFQLVLFEIIN